MVNIDNKLLSEIVEYCRFNNIDDLDGYLNKILQTGFNIDKYGMYQPSIKQNKVNNEVISPTKQKEVSDDKLYD